MHRRVDRAGRLALFGLILALGMTACQGDSADFVPPPTAPPTGSPTPAPVTTRPPPRVRVSWPTPPSPCRSGWESTRPVRTRRSSTPAAVTRRTTRCAMVPSRSSSPPSPPSHGPTWTATAPMSSSPRPIAWIADGEDWKSSPFAPTGRAYATLATVIAQNRASGGDISAIGDLAVNSAGEVVVTSPARQYEPPLEPTADLAAPHLCLERPGVHPDRRAHDLRRRSRRRILHRDVAAGHPVRPVG